MDTNTMFTLACDLAERIVCDRELQRGIKANRDLLAGQMRLIGNCEFSVPAGCFRFAKSSAPLSQGGLYQAAAQCGISADVVTQLIRHVQILPGRTESLRFYTNK